MIDYLQEKKNKKGKEKKSDRLSQKDVKKMLKRSREHALETERNGHSSFNANDPSAPVIHVKDPRDLLKFGANTVKRQVNYVQKTLSKEKKKTFEQFINQEND